MAIASKTSPKTDDVKAIKQGVIAAAATDLATALLLVNDLRMIALNQGVVSSS